MGRKGRKQKGDGSSSLPPQAGDIIDGWTWVDPARVRFQHSRIRPYFSGCGRSVMETLEQIREKGMSPSDLPPIQVIVGPDENDGLGPWYFSLNNRRLWVLKRCKEEGLLENGLVRVRVRQSKSGNEASRYTIDNCAVEAKFIREKAAPKQDDKKSVSESNVLKEIESPQDKTPSPKTSTPGNQHDDDQKECDIPSDSERDSSDDDSNSEVPAGHSNPFGAFDSDTDSD